MDSIPRRTLLVVAGTTGVLVACGGNGSDGTGNQVAPDTSDQGDRGGATPGGGGGETIAAVADVPVGGGTINQDVHIVVTQPADGQFKAFTSICTHQGCDVSFVQNNVISCGCHGSQFSAESGEVERGPATRALAEVAVSVQGSNIVRA